MKEKFTPGPWAVWSCFRKKNGKLPVVHDESGDTVTICEVIDDKEHPEIADADAALISAAPEMYEFGETTAEVLQILLERLGPYPAGINAEIKRLAEERIAEWMEIEKKARGEK